MNIHSSYLDQETLIKPSVKLTKQSLYLRKKEETLIRYFMLHMFVIMSSNLTFYTEIH